MRRIRVSSKDVIKYALVDDCDYERLRHFKWSLVVKKTAYYALRTVNTPIKKTYQMHREVLGIHTMKCDLRTNLVDHINKNGLDNRRSNLRLCNRMQNIANSKIKSNKRNGRYKGVYRPTESKSTWAANIQAHGKKYHLGTFKTQEEAAAAYNKAASKYFGEFARPNKFRGEN